MLSNPLVSNMKSSVLLSLPLALIYNTHIKHIPKRLLLRKEEERTKKIVIKDVK
jgi:hypothetical protein